MNTGESEKKYLILKFYNHMVKGKAWLFVSFLLSGFCVSDIELVCVVLFSSIVVSVFSSMMRSSPVFNVLEIIVSSSEDKFCSVSDAFPVTDFSSEVKLLSELKYSFEKKLSNAYIFLHSILLPLVLNWFMLLLLLY